MFFHLGAPVYCVFIKRYRADTKYPGGLTKLTCAAMVYDSVFIISPSGLPVSTRVFTVSPGAGKVLACGFGIYYRGGVICNVGI